MTRRFNHEDEESTLFDLPLHRSDSSPSTDEEAEAEAEPGDAAGDEEPFGRVPEDPEPDTPAAVASRTDLPTDEAIDSSPTAAAAAPNISFAMTLPFDAETEPAAFVGKPDSTAPRDPVSAGFGSLLLAGLVDLGLIFVGMVTAILGAAALGAPPGPEDWPALLVLGLTVSFPYYVVPLAFWGRSAGMAAFSLFSRSDDGRPLSFRQAVIRWIAILITLGTLGLAGLVALSGRSLADRLSATQTLARH